MRPANTSVKSDGIGRRLFFLSRLLVSPLPWSALRAASARGQIFPLQSSLVQDRQAWISAGPSALRILGGAFPSQRTEDASPLQGRRACTSMFIPLLFTFYHPFSGLIPRLPGTAGTDVFFVVLFQRRHVHLFPTLPAEPVNSAVHTNRSGIPAL